MPTAAGGRPATATAAAAAVFEQAAIYAHSHAEVLSRGDLEALRNWAGTQSDAIYEAFRRHFPNLDVSYVTEHSITVCQRVNWWRFLLEMGALGVPDAAVATALCRDVDDDYGDNNVIYVCRVMFYGVELARAREGYYDEDEEEC